jgi:hypothetical protein
MSWPTEYDVQNPASSLPGIVWTRRSLAMQCANPQCSKELLYFREGRLQLLELDSYAQDQFPPDDGAFAIRSLPGRFFWLCGDCARTYTVKRWTPSGLIVVLRNQNTVDSNPRPADRITSINHGC